MCTFYPIKKGMRIAVKLEREYQVGIKDIGMNNEMTNYAFLSFLEEIACTHSDIVKYGISDISTNKRVWLLMDWHLKVLERPKFGEKLTIRTWARPIQKNLFYTYRDFEVLSNNKKVAIATSKWVLFDLETKRIAKIENSIISRYNPEEEFVLEQDIPKIKEPTEIIQKEKYIVKRSDIDINKHMHNLNYLKVAYEVLPEEEYFKEEKNEIRIMYKHQILLGETVNCYYSKEENKQTISIKSEDDKILHAIVELS